MIDESFNFSPPADVRLIRSRAEQGKKHIAEVRSGQEF
jgi:hypothetical protein